MALPAARAQRCRRRGWRGGCGRRRRRSFCPRPRRCCCSPSSPTCPPAAATAQCCPRFDSTRTLNTCNTLKPRNTLRGTGRNSSMLPLACRRVQPKTLKYRTPNPSLIATAPISAAAQFCTPSPFTSSRLLLSAPHFSPVTS